MFLYLKNPGQDSNLRYADSSLSASLPSLTVFGRSLIDIASLDYTGLCLPLHTTRVKYYSSIIARLGANAANFAMLSSIIESLKASMVSFAPGE